MLLALISAGLLGCAVGSGSRSQARTALSVSVPAANATPAASTNPVKLAVSPNPCGPRSASVIAAVDTAVARRIYAQELASPEVSADIRHVTSSSALLAAVAQGSAAAAHRAVHALVYTPHWHIVRLRVLRAGKLLADVGGPYIIAPVSGALRVHGRTIGEYVLSVQDDEGYVKLVTRFIGVPVDLYRGSRVVMGTLRPAPGPPAAGATARIGGRAYLASVFAARAFPAGVLHVALLVASPPPAIAAASCADVEGSAWGGVATHLAARFEPLASHYQELVTLIRTVTGGRVYVRSGAHWMLALLTGGWLVAPPHALFDNAPLWELLRGRLKFDRIPRGIYKGHLQAVGISATSYGEACSTTFFAAAEGVRPWRRTAREGVRVQLTLEHLMASLAIPFVFRSIPLQGRYYGDGAMRQTSPLSPAFHFGANRLLIIGVGAPQGQPPGPNPPPAVEPTFAQMFGFMLDSLFMDEVYSDVERISSFNEISGRRRIEPLVITPSQDLTRIAQRATPMPPGEDLATLGL